MHPGPRPRFPNVLKMATSTDRVKGRSAHTSARQARLVAIVIIATMFIWVGLQFFGGQFGLPVRYVFLFDFAALAAFAWALIVGFGIWRARNRSEE